MQKFKMKRKVIFFLSFYFGFIVMICVLPLQVQRILTLKSGTKDLKVRIYQFEQDNAMRQNLERQKAIVNVEIERLENKIMSSGDIFAAAGYVSGKAKEAGVEVLEIMPDKPRNPKTTLDGKFQVLPVKVEGKGKFHNIIKFVDLLEQGRYFAEIGDLVIRQDEPYHGMSMVVNILLKE